MVALWYQRNGYSVLAQNWRPGPGALNRTGELDLVLARARLVVFCEVKTRTSTRFGSGATSVGLQKQRTLRRLAGQWLGAQETRWEEIRFDVAVVDATGAIRTYMACM